MAAPSNHVYKLGSRGPEVREIQEKLAFLNFFHKTPHEIFDNETMEAVQAFQSEHGMAADGMAGPRTQEKLNDIYEKRSKTLSAARSVEKPQQQSRKKAAVSKKRKNDATHSSDEALKQARSEKFAESFTESVEKLAEQKTKIDEPDQDEKELFDRLYQQKATPYEPENLSENESNMPPDDQETRQTDAENDEGANGLPESFINAVQLVTGFSLKEREIDLSWPGIEGVTDSGWNLEIDISQNPSYSDSSILESYYTGSEPPPYATVPLSVPLAVSRGRAVEELESMISYRLAGNTNGFSGVVFENPANTPSGGLYIAGHLKSKRWDEMAFSSIITELLGFWPEQLVKPAAEVIDAEEAIYYQPIAGFAADDLDREDKLNITQEVNAICSVIAARDVTPPLSIGLFGDWGVGKSFFMKEMSKRIQFLSGKAKEAEEQRGEPGYEREPAYWSDIAQINFNAWHFMDANLWASLTARIFDGLSEHLARGRKTPQEQEQETIYKELALANAAVQELEENRLQAEIERSNKEQALADVQAKIDEKKSKVDIGSAAKAAWQEFRTKNTDLEDDLKKLGMEDLMENSENVQGRIEELRGNWGEARMFLQSLLKGSNLQYNGLLLIIIVAIFYLAIKMIAQFLVDNTSPISDIVDFLSNLAALGGGALTTIAMWYNKVKSSIDRVQTAYEKDFEQSPQMLEAKQEAAAQEAEIQRLQEEEDRFKEELEETRTKLTMLNQRLADLKVGRRLFQFIEERVGSADYQQHLGIIALIRDDLENLSDLLSRNSVEKRKAWKKVDVETNTVTEAETNIAEAVKSAENEPEKTAKGGVSEIDRIILYIDDLDRCPPERVVEVLQAVHLLLAFKLFVVVVAVDSRWLLRSLEKSYPDFLVLDRQSGKQITPSFTRLASTPQNYLEKIFQIAFAIKPMAKDGFDALIESFTIPETIEVTETVKADEATEIQPATDTEAEGQNDVQVTDSENVSTPPENTAIAGPENIDANTNNADSIAQRQTQNVLETDTATEGTAEVNETLNPPHLDIQSHEIAFMKKLYGMLRTPRVVNRFVNTYRLVRASAGENRLTHFENEEAEGYRAVLILLSLLTGFPYEAVVIFKALDRGGDSDLWSTFVMGLEPREILPLPTQQLANTRPDDDITYENDLMELIPPGEVARWRQIHRCMSGIETPGEGTLAPYRSWVRRVARFGLYPIRFE